MSIWWALMLHPWLGTCGILKTQEAIVLQFSPSGPSCFLSEFPGGDDPPVSPLGRLSLEISMGVRSLEPMPCGWGGPRSLGEEGIVQESGAVLG